VHKGQLAYRVRWGLQEHQVHAAQLVPMANRVLPEYRDRLACRVQLAKMARRGRVVPVVSRVHRVLLAQLDAMVHRDRLACRVRRGTQAIWVQQDLQEHKVWPDLWVLRVIRV
jgi:hypothetical protein